MLFDTHAHLGDPKFDADRDEILENAFSAGVARVVEIADSPREWNRALTLARRHPGKVFCALGLHPYFADQWEPPLADELKKKASLPEVVAAGEFGLDYAKCTIPAEDQRRWLIPMLEAAEGAGLPAVLHCREAYADLIPMLRDFYGPKRCPGRFHGVLHCFSGTAEDARAAAQLGFAVGADGPVTYPKNDALRRALLEAGLERIVLETDCPYLPPQSRRGRRNDPSAVVEIARSLAELFGTGIEEVADATTRNARDLFRLES